MKELKDTKTNFESFKVEVNQKISALGSKILDCYDPRTEMNSSPSIQGG